LTGCCRPGQKKDTRKKGDYFLRTPAVTSRAAPIAARMVTKPTGVLCWTAPGVGQLEDGDTVTAAPGSVACAAGVCAGAVGAVVAAPPITSDEPHGRKQERETVPYLVASSPQVVMEHGVYPFLPHRDMAPLSERHSHGAWQVVSGGELVPPIWCIQ
jgi:hypothetical protein